MEIRIKRAYDKPRKTDGYRVLIDRLWPRGITKPDLQVDEWYKDVAPSADLRAWFDHDPEKFQEFSALYTAELDETESWKELLVRARGHDALTLVYAAKDPENNHARVLQEYLQKRRETV